MIYFNWKSNTLSILQGSLKPSSAWLAPTSNGTYCMLSCFNHLTYHNVCNIFKPSIAEYCCILISEKKKKAIDLSSFFHSARLQLSVVQCPAVSITANGINTVSSTLGIIYGSFNCPVNSNMQLSHHAFRKWIPSHFQGKVIKRSNHSICVA